MIHAGKELVKIVEIVPLISYIVEINKWSIMKPGKTSAMKF